MKNEKNAPFSRDASCGISIKKYAKIHAWIASGISAEILPEISPILFFKEFHHYKPLRTLLLKFKDGYHNGRLSIHSTFQEHKSDYLEKQQN